MTSTSLDREVERRLADHDVRYTQGRQAVVHGLAMAQGPRSASELHEAIGDRVPLSSLYRSLAVLEEAGIASPHYSVKGLTRYELAEWLAGHHHHLVCVNCGSVEDVEMTEEQEVELEQLVARISSRASFSPANHALEIAGRCARCT